MVCRATYIEVVYWDKSEYSEIMNVHESNIRPVSYVRGSSGKRDTSTDMVGPGGTTKYEGIRMLGW